MNTFITTQTASTLRSPLRKHTIEEGALTDLSNHATIKLHWTIPFTCTSSVWFTIQSNLKNDPALHLDDLLRHISISAKIATLIKPHHDELYFETHLGGERYGLSLRIVPDHEGKRTATLNLVGEA